MTTYSSATAIVVVKAYSADDAQTYVEEMVNDGDLDIYDYDADIDNGDEETGEAEVEYVTLSDLQAGAEDLEVSSSEDDD